LWVIKNITADLVQIKIELNETKNELAKTKAELAQLNTSQASGEESVAVLQVKLAQTSSLFNVSDLVQIKIELNETKNELAKTRAELAQLNTSQASGEESIAVLQVKLAQTSSLFNVA
jgi:predicted  nucleic acid-binding Zn-ribbon protein